MDSSVGSSMTPKTGLVQEGYMDDKTRTATTPKPGLVREVCREWLLLEDGALAHQLQNQEIAAHYGHNRVRNQIVRQDTPTARKEQEEEFQQALALQRLQQKIREEQEKADAEAAQRLAEELQREEEIQRKVQAIRDEQVARRMQYAAAKPKKKIPPQDVAESKPLEDSSEPICTSIRSMSLNEPMSEEEARQWQELCDLELARKLQQEEEEESKWRRDVSDLGTKLAIEAKDRELALTLQEKEKARLRKAKEKARLKAMQKAAIREQKEHEHHYQLLSEPRNTQHRQYDYHQYNEYPVDPSIGRSSSVTENIALSIDPTWNRRQQSQPPQPPQPTVFPAHRHPAPITDPSRPLPITDLDFPASVQPIVPGQRRGGLNGSQSQLDPSEPAMTSQQPSRSKSGTSCSHQ